MDLKTDRSFIKGILAGLAYYLVFVGGTFVLDVFAERDIMNTDYGFVIGYMILTIIGGSVCYNIFLYRQKKAYAYYDAASMNLGFFLVSLLLSFTIVELGDVVMTLFYPPESIDEFLQGIQFAIYLLFYSAGGAFILVVTLVIYIISRVINKNDHSSAI